MKNYFGSDDRIDVVHGAPFDAQITAMTAGTGPQAGMNLYSWQEMYIDPATGLLQVANPGRSGTNLNGAWAVEANNASLASSLPLNVTLRVRGLVNGSPVYEFSYPPGGSSNLTVVQTPAGTPTISGVTTIEVDAGLVLTNDAGKAKISATAPGSLTVTQTPAGTPSIANVTTIEVDSGLVLTNDAGKAKIATNGAGGVVISIQSNTPSTITLSGGTVTGYSAKIATLSASGTWTLGTSAVWFVDVNGFPPYNVGTQLSCIQVGADTSAVPIYATEEIPLPWLLNQTITTTGPGVWNLNYPFTINGPNVWIFNSPMEICGYQFWCCRIVTQWLGNKNDVDLSEGNTANDKTVYLISSSMPVDLTGIAPAQIAGANGPQTIALVNKGSFPISILNDSSSSAAANRILLPHDTSGSGAAAFLLNPDDTVVLWYDTCFLNNWRVLSSTCVFGKSGSTTHSTGWVPDPQSVVSNPWRFLREDSSWANIHSIWRSSSLTGTFNNWNPANGNNDTWFIDAASGNVVITGIVPGAVILDGSELRIVNVSASNDTITLAHLNAGSAAANQINTFTGSDLVLQDGFYARLIYDDTNTRWQVLDYAPAGVLVDAADTTPGYLASKLVAGTNITLTTQNVGGNENIKISAAATTSDHKVMVDAADTTPGYLAAKLLAGSNITLTLENPGANEDLKVDTQGFTGTISSTIVTAVSCSAGTLSVTTATLSITFSKGICTAASIV